MRKAFLSFILILGLTLCYVPSAISQVNKDYFIWMGRGMVMEDRYKEAIETLNVLLRTDPDVHEAYLWRGIAKYQLEDLLGAEQDFSIALEKNPVYTMAYQYRALTRSRMGKYDEAFEDYKEAIDLRPDYLAPYYSRGVTYLLTAQFDKAVEDFDMYIRYYSKDADAYSNRGLAYLNLRDTTAAFSDFDRAIRTNRESPRGYMERGTLYAEMGETDKALEDFSKAIECDPTYIPSYFSRAIVNYDRHNLMGALEDFDKVIELDPVSSIAYFNRALLRTEIGDYNRALEDYDKAAIYSPGNVIIYYNRAGLYYSLGELEEALKDYDKAIELFPDFANAYLNRASIKYLLRDEKGSERDYRTAENKINEYRSKLDSGEMAALADTSRHFNQLLSFDTKFSIGGSTALSEQHNVTMRPLYRFTYRHPSEISDTGAERYDRRRLNDFLALLDNDMIVFTCLESDVSADEFLKLNDGIYDTGRHDWVHYFENGMIQLALRQYTNAVNSLTTAIELDPSNPFLYINRSTITAEMTDFISSMDDQYGRISLESDQSARGRDSYRTYNYDDAIADLNKAAKLYPELPHIYYNRGNLFALSGEFKEAFDNYTQAIKLNPWFGEAYYNRGLIHIYMKDTRKGLLDISKAGELGIDEAYAILKMYSFEEDN